MPTLKGPFSISEVRGALRTDILQTPGEEGLLLLRNVVQQVTHVRQALERQTE